jgi:hypothetical protein
MFLLIPDLHANRTLLLRVWFRLLAPVVYAKRRESSEKVVPILPTLIYYLRHSRQNILIKFYVNTVH